MTNSPSPSPFHAARLELAALWLSRRQGARFWLIFFTLMWSLAPLAGFPNGPSFRILALVPAPVWMAAAWTCAALLLAPPRVRLVGATLTGILYVAIMACLTLGAGGFSTGTAVYLALVLLAYDVVLGGAQ